jgi:hypothetical protein
MTKINRTELEQITQESFGLNSWIWLPNFGISFIKKPYFDRFSGVLIKIYLLPGF